MICIERSLLDVYIFEILDVGFLFFHFGRDVVITEVVMGNRSRN